jgi:hypothetical protein
VPYRNDQLIPSGTLVAMDLDAAPVGRDVQVVDPEVRAHIYSLVTAVSHRTLIRYSIQKC